MLSARVIRRSIKRWPEKLGTVNREFLPTAGKVVEGAAKRAAPVDSGRLKASITSRTSADQAVIGTNVAYAPYVEYGTRFTRAQPYMRPAVDKNRKSLRSLWVQIFRRVYGR